MKSHANALIKTGLNYATGVLFELDDAGINVFDVEIDGGRPVITTDRGPPSARPAHSITQTINGTRRTLFTAELNGCKIQWECKGVRVPMARVA